MDPKKAGATDAHEFIISRTFAAPRDLVWRAWTDAEELKKWFGPQGCTLPHAHLDLRPGGIFHYAMRLPDGKEMWGKWLFREIVAPQKLVMISSFSDARGGITRHPLSDTWPLETLSTTTFDEQRGGTTVTVRWSPFDAAEQEIVTFDGAQESMRTGWGGTFEQLGNYLATLS